MANKARAVIESTKDFFTNDTVAIFTCFIAGFTACGILDKYFVIPDYILNGSGVVALIVILYKLLMEGF